MSDIIFTKLKNSIVTLEYQPGDMLNEELLSKEYKVSRTPIREAIKKLEMIGLVNVMPKIGNYVSYIDIKEILSILKIKAALEGVAAELAIENINKEQLTRLSNVVEALSQKEDNAYDQLIKLDQQFHEIVRLATGNKTLINFLEILNIQSARSWKYYQSRLPANHATSLAKIYKAIAATDAQSAKKCSEEHVNAMREEYMLAIFKGVNAGEVQ